MRITRLDARLLRMPLDSSARIPVAGPVQPRPAQTVLLARVETDSGVSGIGFAHAPSGGRALLTALNEDLSPLIAGENPLDIERLWARVRALDNPAAHRAHAAIDVALWDLKGKAAGLPLWRLLGGARESAKAFSAEPASASLSADGVIALARPALALGLTGIRLSIRGVDPEAESRTIVTVRDALGEAIWFAITVENSFDYETALPMARFIEEEIGADWFEDALADDDLTGYQRLAARSDTPLAAGGRFTDVAQFVRLVETGAPVTLRPDVSRLGGLTPCLKVAALAELNRRPVVPRLLPEVGLHLACGLPGIPAVEYTPLLAPLFTAPARPTGGSLRPTEQAGLGVELNGEAVARFAV